MAGPIDTDDKALPDLAGPCPVALLETVKRSGAAHPRSCSVAESTGIGHGRIGSAIAKAAATLISHPVTALSLLDLAAFDDKPLTRDPFDFIIVDNFIRPAVFKDVVADFPAIPGPGSHPPAELTIAGQFKALMEELEGKAFRAAVERKFDLDLEGRPTMYTVRGFVSDRDGHIHTDSKTKIITVLLYLNEGWEADGGRLRLLRSNEGLDNPVAEVSPNGGTLLVFRRSDNSWHGHKTFKGQRRAIQLNWVTGADVVASEQRRHAFATRVKKIKNIFLPMAG